MHGAHSHVIIIIGITFLGNYLISALKIYIKFFVLAREYKISKSKLDSKIRFS